MLGRFLEVHSPIFMRRTSRVSLAGDFTSAIAIENDERASASYSGFVFVFAVIVIENERACASDSVFVSTGDFDCWLSASDAVR